MRERRSVGLMETVSVDLARLIAIMAQEVASRARQRDLPAPGDVSGAVAGLIDHTLLRPDATRGAIAQLCAEARQHSFATVCVHPTWVSLAAQALQGSPVGVCAVVGFPLGATTPDVKQYETRRALADGAHEIDMVMNIGALKSGDFDLVLRDIEAVTTACRAAEAISKVIIEAALLTDAEKVAACERAVQGGATYVKTSTGFGPGGASVVDVQLMKRTVGPSVGVKAAGGIRDLATFEAMVAAGATRIGTSNGVVIVHQAATGAAPRRSTSSY